MKDEDLDPGLTKKQQHPTEIKMSGNITVFIDALCRWLFRSIL
jgi:hypothetical protein